jgi:hypothetical protein
MTEKIYGVRNKIPSPSHSSDAGLAVRRLAGLLAGQLEQTSVRIHGHGRPRQPLVTSHYFHTDSSELTSVGWSVVLTEQ